MLSKSSLESLSKASNVEEFLEVLEIKPHYPVVDLMLNEFVLFGVRELDLMDFTQDEQNILMLAFCQFRNMTKQKATSGLMRIINKFKETQIKCVPPKPEPIPFTEQLMDLERELTNYVPNSFQVGCGEGFSLVSAVITGHQEVIEKHFNKEPASLNKMNARGWTPLMYSMAQGCSDGVISLLKNGADHRPRNYEGLTALGLGASYGHRSTIRTFIRFFQDRESPRAVRCIVNELDVNNRNPLHHSAENRQWEACEVLAKAGCDANQQDKDGNTPLFIACKSNHAATIRAVYNAHGNPFIRNKEKQNCFTVIADEKKYLIEAALSSDSD